MQESIFTNGTRNMTRTRYQAAIAAFDEANAEDPNKEILRARNIPRNCSMRNA